MIKVNLIPPEYLARQKSRTQTLRILAVVALSAVAFAGITVVHITGAYEAERIIKEKQAKIRSLQAQVDKVKELEAAKASVKAHLDALNDLLRARFYYPYFMRDMAKSLANSVWLSSVMTTLGEGGKIDFNVSAHAKNGDDVAAWVNTLENNPRFSNVTLGQMSVSGSEQEQTVSFPLKAVYTAPVN